MGKDEVKVKRTSRACDRCKKLKIKCDDLKPKCKNCSKHNLQCTYRLTNKKGINKRDLNINRITNIDFANNDPNYLSAFNNVYDASKFRFDDINPNDISNKNIFWYLNPPAANPNNSLDPSTTNIATGNNNVYKNNDRVNNKSPSEGSNTSNNNFGLNTDFKAQTQQQMQDQFMQIQQQQQQQQQQKQQLQLQQQQQKQQLQLQQQQQQPNYSINIDSIPTAGETPLLAPNFTNFSIDQSPDFQSPQNFGYGVESPNFDKLIKLNFLQNNSTISDLAAFQGNPLQVVEDHQPLPQQQPSLLLPQKREFVIREDLNQKVNQRNSATSPVGMNDPIQAPIFLQDTLRNQKQANFTNKIQTPNNNSLLSPSSYLNGNGFASQFQGVSEFSAAALDSKISDSVESAIDLIFANDESVSTTNDILGDTLHAPPSLENYKHHQQQEHPVSDRLSDERKKYNERMVAITTCNSNVESPQNVDIIDTIDVVLKYHKIFFDQFVRLSGFMVQSKFRTNFNNGNPLTLCLSDMICAIVTYLTGLSSIDYAKKVDLATEGGKPFDSYEVKRAKLVKSVNYYKRATSNLKRLMSTNKPYLLSIIWNSVQIVQLLLLTADYEFNIGKSGRAIITLSKATKICQLKGYDLLDASNSFGISDIMIDAWAEENELFDIDLLLRDDKKKYELSKLKKLDENSSITNELTNRLTLRDELETSSSRQATNNNNNNNNNNNKDNNLNDENSNNDASSGERYFTSKLKNDLKSKLIARTNINVNFLDNIVRTGSIEEAHGGTTMNKSSSVSEDSGNDGTNDTSANNSIADSSTPIFLNNDVIEDSLSLSLIRENEGYDELFVKEERRRAFWRLYTLNLYVTIGTGMPTSLSSFQIRTRLPNTADLNTYHNKKNSEKDGDNNSIKSENNAIDLAKIKTPYLIDALKSVKRGEALQNVDSYGIYCLLLTVQEEVVDWCKKICGEYDETNLTNMEKFNRIVNEYNVFSNELKLFEKQFSSYSFSKDFSLDYPKLAIKCSQISMLHSIIMNFTKFLIKKKVLPNDFLNEFYYDIRTKCIELTNEVLDELTDNENLVELFDKEPFCFFTTHTSAKSSIQLILSSAQPLVKPINADTLLQLTDKLFSLFTTLEKSPYSIMTSFLDHYKMKLDSFGEDPYDTGYFREFIGNY